MTTLKSILDECCANCPSQMCVAHLCAEKKQEIMDTCGKLIMVSSSIKRVLEEVKKTRINLTIDAYGRDSANVIYTIHEKDLDAKIKEILGEEK